MKLSKNETQALYGFSKAIEEIVKERIKQNEKWGEQNHLPFEWMPILMEEVGEASKEAVDLFFNKPFRIKNPVDGETIHVIPSDELIEDTRMKAFRKEMIQVAAVAIQAIQCIDRNVFDKREKSGNNGE